jgi:RES domain-containing protein
MPWSGTAYRSTALHYQKPGEILSGEGSRRHGGRWKPRGELATVYASLDPETAMAETLSHVRYYRLPEQGAMPRVFWAIQARLGLVLDLRRPQVRRILATPLDALTGEDWRRTSATPAGSLTQALGRAAFLAGFEALLAPSAARREGTNLVAFPANLETKNYLWIGKVRP